MKQSEAYWISPENIIFEVNKKHIDLIINHPSDFGVTRNYIETKYKDYNEKLGFEGKARSDIMLELMKRGWIRVRYYGKNDIWKFQVYQFDLNEKKLITHFIFDGINCKIIKKYSDINILVTKDDQIIRSSVTNIKSYLR